MAHELVAALTETEAREKLENLLVVLARCAKRNYRACSRLFDLDDDVEHQINYHTSTLPQYTREAVQIILDVEEILRPDDPEHEIPVPEELKDDMVAQVYRVMNVGDE